MIRAESIGFGQSPKFELHVARRQLLADGVAVSLGSRAFDLLVALVGRAGELVSRAELVDAVWPDSVVEENNLSVQINALRRVLGNEHIRTVPGRGYCFAAEIAGAPAAAPQPAAQPAEKHRSNLPATLRPIVGRQGDIEQLRQRLSEQRLVSIVGPAGAGKTLLAQHLLRGLEAGFAHGVCFVELAALGPGTALEGVVAAALGLQLGGPDGRKALLKAVQPLQVLMALDNAEHLIAPVADLLSALIEAAPQLSFVVTSQAPLKLPHEQVYRLRALALPPRQSTLEQALQYGALALFDQRAQAADSRFRLAREDVGAAVDLCQALEGLPLAIELAAWRAPVLGVRKLAESMNERLKLLQGHRRGVPQRQQTMRAALQWSYGLLDPAQQTVFRRMAVVVDSLGLDILEEVLADPPGGELDKWAVLEALTTLVERSLVDVVPGHGGQMRYRLLLTPKALAHELLVQSGEFPALRERHARALARLLGESVKPVIYQKLGHMEWRNRFQLDMQDGLFALNSATEGGLQEETALLAPALLFLVSGAHRDRRAGLWDLCRTVALREGHTPQGLVALGACIVEFVRPKGVTLSELLAEFVACAKASPQDDEYVLRRCVAAVVSAHWIRLRGINAENRDQIAENLDSLRELDPGMSTPTMNASRYLCMASLSSFDGRHDEALGWTRLAAAQNPTSTVGKAWLVMAALDAGSIEEARAVAEELVQTSAGSRYVDFEAGTRALLGAALLQAGLRLPAIEQLQAALQLFPPGEVLAGMCLDYLAFALANGDSEDLVRSAVLLGCAEAAYKDLGMTRMESTKKIHAELVRILSAALETGHFERLRRNGSELDWDNVRAVGCALSGPSDSEAPSSHDAPRQEWRGLH